MRFAAILVVASLLAMSVLGQVNNNNGVIGTRFPDARVVINQYFDAVAAKQIDASLRLFTPNATISVLDYGCFTGMDLARANTYFHGSTKWFNLLQRSLQEVVQVGSLAAASFTDAGIMPEAVQSKGMWNFLLNSMLMVNVNAFGELENLYLHTDFLNETAKAPYVKGVNNFFNTFCAGNVQAIEALFVPNAVIVNARHQTSPSQVVDQIQTINASTFASLPWALYQPQCGSMVTQIVAGCNLAIAQATVLMNIVGFAHEAQHGFWMFEFQFDNTTGAVTGIKRLEITINVAVN